MNDITKMLKKAQEIQMQIQSLQNSMESVEKVGSSGGGLCKVTVNGKGEVKKVDIDSSLLNPKEVEILQDLLVVACNDAKEKADSHMEKEMNKITGGMGAPGEFKLPF